MKTLTVILLIIAVITAVLAYMPAKGETQGQQDPQFFGPSISDYDEAAAEARRVADLEIVTYDPSSVAVNRFQVKKTDGIWTIPSHHDYPADGGERVGQIAGSVLGIERGSLISSDPAEHAEFRVADPMDDSRPLDEERGQRVVLRDAQGGTILDLIIGKPSAQKAELRYVREYGNNDVFLAKMSPQLTTRFTDFVETDLLGVLRDDIRRLSLDHHSVDDLLNRVRPGEKASFYRLTSDGDWVDDNLPQGKQIVTSKVDELAIATGRVVLQGVRPSGADLPAEIRARLFSNYGFFGGQDGRIYGNEGGLNIETADGMTYMIFFGEIAAGEGDALTAGELPGEDLSREEIIARRATTGDNRHMAIFVVYDQTKDEDFAAISSNRAKVFRELAGVEEGETLSADLQAKLDEEVNAERDQHIKAREDRLTELRSKFGRFFFIIDDSVFRELHPTIPDLFEDAPKPISTEADAPNADPSATNPAPPAEGAGEVQPTQP